MTYCSVVIVLASVGLTNKRFGHYAILKNLTLRSPRRKQDKTLELQKLTQPPPEKRQTKTAKPGAWPNADRPISNAKSWCIMAEFQTFNRRYSY